MRTHRDPLTVLSVASRCRLRRVHPPDIERATADMAPATDKSRDTQLTVEHRRDLDAPRAGHQVIRGTAARTAGHCIGLGSC